MKPTQFIKIGMFAVLASTSLIAQSNSSFAQNATGNGGDAIVCGNEAVMLDYYEGLQKGYDFGLLSPKLSVQENLSIIFNNLKKQDLSIPNHIAPIASDLMFDLTEAYNDITGLDVKKSKVSYGIEDDLIDIDDSKEVFIPKSCKKVQIAIQGTPRANGDKFIAIHIPTLKKMNSMQKAILIAHEAIYSIAKKTVSDSTGTRFFNSFISSKDLNTIHWSEFQALGTRTSPGFGILTQVVDGYYTFVSDIKDTNGDRFSAPVIGVLKDPSSTDFETQIKSIPVFRGQFNKMKLVSGEGSDYFIHTDATVLSNQGKANPKGWRCGNYKRYIKDHPVLHVANFKVSENGQFVFQASRVLKPICELMGDGSVDTRLMTYIENYATVTTDNTGKILEVKLTQ